MEIKKKELLELVKNPFEYRMQFYNSEDINNWIELYERFKSYKAVREHLSKECTNPPRSETIRLKLKEYFGKDYDYWLKHIKNK